MARQRSTPATPKASKPAAKPKATKATASKPKAAPRTKKTAPLAAPPSGNSLDRGEGRSKFTLYNLLGEPRAYYVAEGSELERPKADPKAKTQAHSIIVVDRSGSMYSSMADLRDHLLKLLTLYEFSAYNLIVTLTSYSSQGDARVHFQRVPIKDIMKPNSKEQGEIKKLQVTGLTCISGGLQLAESLVKDGELTAITLHSDGYANDPSSTAEAATLNRLSQLIRTRDAFLNTIAYTDYADFRLLSNLANGASGACVKAKDIQMVFESLKTSTTTLGASLTPPIDVELPNGIDFQVFVSQSAGRVNGAAGPLRVVGIKAEDDATIYRYQKISEKEYKSLKDVPEKQTSAAVFAFAKGQLADGSLNTAKYALASTFDATLLEPHAKALTNGQIAGLSLDLEALLFHPEQLAQHNVLTEVPVNKQIPVVSLCAILGEHLGDWSLNLKHLRENYQRRGLKRLEGTRDEMGNVVPPWLTTEYLDTDDFTRVSSFDVNRNSATLDMLIARRVRLVTREGGKAISQVAGILLDKLSTFNNYTLVGDGELNVNAIQIRISSKKLYEQLWKEGLLHLEDGSAASKFDASTTYMVHLDRLPLIPPFSGSVDLDGVFDELAKLKVLASVASAHLKEESADYTPEQVEELKKHYLSKSLFLSMPTTNPYTDLQQALAEGSVDTRTSYKIDIGTTEILNLSKLHSANKFLDRLYEVSDAKGAVEKPTFEGALDGTWSYKHKTLSAKTKVTKVDDFMKVLFDDFLGVKANGAAVDVLTAVGATDLADIVKGRAKGKQPNRKTFVEALTDAKKKLEARQEELFLSRLSALVFYIGASGLLPDEVNAKAMTADQISTKYPELALSKDEKEGTFFEIGETILTIYAKTEYFSR